MPDDGEPGTRDVHQTVLGGEHVLIRRARPEDVALYQDFLAGVSADDDVRVATRGEMPGIGSVGSQNASLGADV